MIKCMLDKKTFTRKPNGIESGGIQNRLSQTEISIEELSNLLCNGATFKPAYLNGTKSKDWVSQQIFALDFDEGTTIKNELKRCEELNILPVFGYKTFSYTEYKEKFRLVFCNNEVITDVEIRNDFQNLLIELFPSSDSVTFDPARLFFGGKGLIECDYNNKINIKEIMENNKEILDKINNDNNKSFSLSLSSSLNKSSKGKLSFLNTNTLNSSSISIAEAHTPTPMGVTDVLGNIKAIKSLDIVAMKEILNIDEEIKTICTNKQEVYNYMNGIDLCEFTNIYGMINCILPEHEDDTPSAHIYETDNGTQIYKCFGCKAKYTIISLVEKLAKCKRVKAIEFIKQVYNIELQQTEWQKEQLEILDTNIELLLSDEFKEIYPQLHSLIRTRKSNLIALNNYAKMNVKDEDFSLDGNPLFFVSLNNLMDVFGSKDKTRTSQSITLFTLLSLLNKIPHENLPEETLKKANHIAAKYKHKKLVNYYSIDSYGVNSLEESNKIAILLKENNISLKGLSREYLLRTFGIEFTNKVFPQYEYENNLGTTEQSDENSSRLVGYILKGIEVQGYVLEKDLKVNGMTENQWRRSIQEILDSYGLVKVTANKEIKEKFSINVSARSYPKIIVRKD